jgi:hypothetical protein
MGQKTHSSEMPACLRLKKVVKVHRLVRSVEASHTDMRNGLSALGSLVAGDFNSRSNFGETGLGQRDGGCAHKFLWICGQNDFGRPNRLYTDFQGPNKRLQRVNPNNQSMTKLSPTLLSSVALAACRDTDHVWSPTIPSAVTPPQAWNALTEASVWGPKSPSMP